MFRSMSRTAAVAVVALTLVLASVPAAQASPFSSPSLDTRAGWFDATLSWLSSFLFGAEIASPGTFSSTFAAAKTTDPTAPSPDSNTTMSGSCINPDGKPSLCY